MVSMAATVYTYATLLSTGVLERITAKRATELFKGAIVHVLICVRNQYSYFDHVCNIENLWNWYKFMQSARNTVVMCNRSEERSRLEIRSTVATFFQRSKADVAYMQTGTPAVPRPLSANNIAQWMHYKTLVCLADWRTYPANTHYMSILKYLA